MPVDGDHPSWFAFRKAPDGKSIDMYTPQLGIRPDTNRDLALDHGLQPPSEGANPHPMPKPNPPNQNHLA